MAGEKPVNVQDVFLNHVRKNKTPLTVFLINGVKLQGIVTWFDQSTMLLRREGHSQLVYKHAISTIMTQGPIMLFENNTQQEGILQKFKHEIKVIMPDRPILYENCNKRFLKMLDAGGIDEVRALHANKLSPQIFSAIGVRQIMNYLNREMLFEAMINDSQTKTRQYAKRQVTWFRRYIHI